MRVKLTVMYDGSGFCGFQRQKDKVTVQGEIESAIYKLYGTSLTIKASGRTDAGVHALGQVIHFDAPKEISADSVLNALNFYLPPSVRIKSAEFVSGSFDARKSARKKTYIYNMYTAAADNPLIAPRAARLENPPDLAVMRQAAGLFIGMHDFYAFYCQGSSAKTTTRTVYECAITEREECGEKLYSLKITANGFLYKMVRVIAGAILDAAYGKITLSELENLLTKPALVHHKNSMPPQGLCLLKVEYDN